MKYEPRAFPSNAIDPEFGGMTLRDWFAGQALVGILTVEGEANGVPWVCLSAYVIADAMMAEREQRMMAEREQRAPK